MNLQEIFVCERDRSSSLIVETPNPQRQRFLIVSRALSNFLSCKKLMTESNIDQEFLNTFQ